MYNLVAHLCLGMSLKIATGICQFSQKLRTKLDMLFGIAKSIEIVILLGKQLFYPKILDSCKTLFCCCLCPH